MQVASLVDIYICIYVYRASAHAPAIAKSSTFMSTSTGSNSNKWCEVLIALISHCSRSRRDCAEVSISARRETSFAKHMYDALSRVASPRPSRRSESHRIKTLRRTSAALSLDAIEIFGTAQSCEQKFSTESSRGEKERRDDTRDSRITCNHRE